MAKITVSGDAIVITSSLTLENIQTLKEYEPNALTLYEADENGKKQPVFSVDTCKGAGSINALGACFSRETRGDDKRAVITILIDEKVGEDVVDYITATYGRAINMLEKIEAQVPAALERATAFKTGMRNKITLA